MNIDDFRLSIGCLIRLRRGFFNPAHRETGSGGGQGGEMVAGLYNHTGHRRPRAAVLPTRHQNLRALPPHNSHRSHPTKASQGDEVAGSKPAGPEEARFERARPVLIHRVLLATPAKRSLCPLCPLWRFFPSCSFVPSCFKKITKLINSN